MSDNHANLLFTLVQDNNVNVSIYSFERLSRLVFTLVIISTIQTIVNVSNMVVGNSLSKHTGLFVQWE